MNEGGSRRPCVALACALATLVAAGGCRRDEAGDASREASARAGGELSAERLRALRRGGNVWEWCADWYAEGYYAASPRENPRGPEAGAERVMRGGSWICAENFCGNYRVAACSRATPDTGLDNLGFRCARDASPEEGSRAAAP